MKTNQRDRRRPALLALGLLGGLLVLGDPGQASGQEDQLQLKDAPGRPLVMAQCSVCHSVDYIPMNAPFLEKKGWEAEINKMIKVMGANVPVDQVPTILDYLVKNYGK